MCLVWQRAFGHTSARPRGGVHGFDTGVDLVDIILAVIPWQLEQFTLQFAQRNLVFASAGINHVNRHATRDAVNASAFFFYDLFQALWGTLTDEHDAWVTDHSVQQILLAGHAHTLFGKPNDAEGVTQVIQRPTSSAWLVFDALVHRRLQTASKNPHRDNSTQHDADRQHEPLTAPQRPEQENRHGDTDEGEQHQWNQRFIILALHVECLPHLRERLLTLRSLGFFQFAFLCFDRGLVALRLVVFRHVSHFKGCVINLENF